MLGEMVAGKRLWEKAGVAIIAILLASSATWAGTDDVKTIEVGYMVIDPAQVAFSYVQNGRTEPLGTLRLQGARDKWAPAVNHGNLQQVQVSADSVDAVFDTRGKDSNGRLLEVHYTAAEEGQVAMTWQLEAGEDSFVPPNRRLVFGYAEEGRWGRPEGLSRQKPINGKQQVQINYGPFLLCLTFDEGMIGWVGGPSRYMGINLTQAAWSELTSDGLTVTAEIVPADLKNRRRDIFRRIADAQAYLEAIRIWELASNQDAWMSEADQRLTALIHELGHVDITAAQTGDPDDEDDITTPSHLKETQGNKRKGQSADNEEPPIGGWRQLVNVEKLLDEVESQIQSFLETNRDELFAKAKALNQNMNFGVGLGYNRDPRERFLKWATFNMAFFRMGARRVRVEDPQKQDDPEALLEEVAKVMAEADSYGAKAIVLVSGGTRASVAEDMTYSDKLLPKTRPSFYRYNFNSKRFRDTAYKDFKLIGEKTRDIPNIAVYQINNEPFWSTRSDPILGYNPGEIGCSNETWREQIRRFYPSNEAWLEALQQRYEEMRENSRITRIYLGRDASPKLWKSILLWPSIDQAGFDPQYVEGLTFVDFLKNRYGSLKELNETWFADDTDRYFATWDQVFPPFPLGEQAGNAALDDEQTGIDFPAEWAEGEAIFVRPMPKDIAAWVDWAEFWAHCVNDAQRSHRQGLVDGGATAPISTNAVMGHFINGSRGNTADIGCLPWITMDGLDAMGIDFYSTSYLQGYIASLRDASNGRPVYIHETEGPKSGYVAMYSFAYGASGVAIWRRSHDIPPRAAVKLLKVTRAMADPQLQFHSKPVTDGMAILYSLDSMYLSDAVTGSGRDYAAHIQGGIYLMNRLQVLFDLYADRQLAEGVPDDVKVIFAPGAFGLSDATIQALHRFVQRDGILVTDAEFGQYDRHGRTRDPQALRWLKENKRVVMLPRNVVRDWRHGIHGSDHSPRRWGVALPDFAPIVQQVIQHAVPRTVTYRNPKEPNELPIRVPGARLADNGQLFVFVDPWSEQTRLDVRGNFWRADNLYTGESLPVQRKAGFTSVMVDKGPAIIRLTP